MQKIYVKTDVHNRIISCASPGFKLGNDAIQLYYDGEITENFSLIDERDIYLFKRDGDEMIARTEEEMNADYIPSENRPTDEERINALEARLASYEAAYVKGVNEA